MSLASIASGADGVMLSSSKPEMAAVDPLQPISYLEFDSFPKWEN